MGTQKISKQMYNKLKGLYKYNDKGNVCFRKCFQVLGTDLMMLLSKQYYCLSLQKNNYELGLQVNDWLYGFCFVYWLFSL